jgi:hypothetical protein
MSFASPLFLLGLLLVPLGVLAYVAARRRSRRYAVRFTAAPTLKLAAGTIPAWRTHLPAAAALAAVVVALVLVLGGGEDSAPGGFEVALRPVAGETAQGRAVLASGDAGIKMQLWVRGLPRDPGIVYEVHCDAPGWSASAGTFRADSHGRAYVVLNTAARRGEYDAIRVVRRSRSNETDVLQAKL